jgi:hypothetical protein
MTTAPVNAAVKALTYAEEQLGVHSVYDEARENYVKLDNLMTDLGNARDKKRTLERDIQDREFEIMSDERSKHPEMSAASMDKHLKLAYHADPPLRVLREEHISIVNDLDGIELDKSALEIAIKIAVARLHELGGYFEYLAAIKNQAGSTDTANETSTS